MIPRMGSADGMLVTATDLPSRMQTRTVCPSCAIETSAEQGRGFAVGVGPRKFLGDCGFIEIALEVEPGLFDKCPVFGIELCGRRIFSRIEQVERSEIGVDKQIA